MRRTTALLVSAVLFVSLLPSIGSAASGFQDVGPGHVFYEDITWLADSGITRGCNPPQNTRFCPDDRVTRGQMAAFLTRALNLKPGKASFSDTKGSVFAADVSALADAGITRGCNPPANTKFCPDDYVTRGQMAAFLTRALGLKPGSASFSDTKGHVFAADVAALADAGITKGCNPPQNTEFCPDDYVTRGQMAAFLHRALSGSGSRTGGGTGGGGGSDTAEYVPPAGKKITGLAEEPSIIGGYGVEDRPASISADGKKVVFATALGKTRAQFEDNQVYLWDSVTNKITLVSKTPSGAPGNGPSINPVVSANGKWVAFLSKASNLTSDPKPSKDQWDAYLYDVEKGEVVLVSKGANGKRSELGVNPGLGFLVVGPTYDIYPDISDDGRFVTFVSVDYRDNNLNPGVPREGLLRDSGGFLYDHKEGYAVYVTGNADGTAPAGDEHVLALRISGDGERIVWETTVEHRPHVGALSNLYWRKVDEPGIYPISGIRDESASVSDFDVSFDGKEVAYIVQGGTPAGTKPTGSNFDCHHVYLWSEGQGNRLVAKGTCGKEKVSHDSLDSIHYRPVSISGDGNKVVYSEWRIEDMLMQYVESGYDYSPLRDVKIFDVTKNKTTTLPGAGGKKPTHPIWHGVISASGDYVVSYMQDDSFDTYLWWTPLK